MKYSLTFLLLFYFVFGFSQNIIVSEIKVQGNKKLKRSFVKKIVSIKTGVILDSSQIKEDVKRLKRLPSVAHAYFQVLPELDDKCKVVYHIEENFTIIPFASIYTTNDDEFAYRIGVYEYNLFGQNITLGGFYQNDIYSSYAINIRAPYLFSKSFGLALNHQNLSTQEPVFFDNTTADYKYNNKSFEILGLYELNFNNRFEIGINYFIEDYNYKKGAVNSNVPLVLNVHKLLYKGIYEYNNLDYYYQYLSGFKNILNFQYVTSTSGDLPEFLIGWNDFYFYKRIGEKGNWANRIRVGFSSNTDSPFAPFSVDNNVNLRGVGITIDRGTGAIVLNTEYRHTLFEKKWFILQGNTFVDTGTWRNPGGDLGDFSKSQNIRVYPGLGLRFMHKNIYNAVLRIDYGYGITKNSSHGLVFGIGQYF